MSDVSKSPTIGALAGALAKAQAEFKPVLKDSDNPYFNSKYADLATVIAATQPALAKYELAVMQMPVVRLAEKEAGVETTMAHSSGEWVSQTLMLSAVGRGKDGAPKFDPQTVGAAITYARRYAYQGLVGVAAEVDDDGNSISEAAGTGSKHASQEVAKKFLNERAGSESLVFRPDGFGLTFLEGLNGIAILRANLSPEQTKLMQRINTAWAIPDQYAEAFYEIAAKQGLKVSIGTGSPANGAAQTGTAKAVGTPAESAPTSLPIIKSAEITGEEKKRRLVVRVAEGSLSNQYACWEQHLWPILIAGTNQTCALVLKENPKNPKYINIIDVAKIGDRYYENGKPIPTMNDPAKGFTASDDDLPF